jgi:hypothetical protein
VKRRAFVLVPLVFLALVSVPASATDWQTNDPPVDVFDGDTQQNGAGRLDVLKVEHSDDGNRARYVLTMKDAFESKDLRAASIYLDDLSGMPRYDCVQADVTATFEGSRLRGAVNQCSGGGADPKRLGVADVSHARRSKTLVIAFDIAVLRRAGFDGQSYGYTVRVSEADSQRTDAVPNNSSKISHTLDVPTTTPMPEPTPRRTKRPTPKPLLDLRASASPSATPAATDEAVAFPAPVETGSSTALRIAAIASVLAAAAAVFVRARADDP